MALRLEALGIDVQGVQPDDFIVDAVVVLHVVRVDADTRVVVACTPGMSWVTKRGMLEVARDAAAGRLSPAEDDD